MIVAPAVGVFRSAGVDGGTALYVGDVVGVVEGPGTRESWYAARSAAR